jgi:hypothetical protein
VAGEEIQTSGGDMKTKITPTQAALLKTLPDDSFLAGAYRSKSGQAMHWLWYHGWVHQIGFDNHGRRLSKLTDEGRKLRDELNAEAT